MRILLNISFVLILIVVILAWYTGVFTSLNIVEKEEGGYVLVGEDFTGPYYKVGPVMSKVDSSLRESGIQCSRGFGIYYDDPKTTPKEKCKSFVGNILEEKDFNKKEEILKKGLKITELAKTTSLVIEFPVRTTLSYMIAPMKVYPALSKYMKEKNFKPVTALEIYDVPGKKTLYIMQYSK